jgi:predicted nucleic acid-binding protein
MQDKKLIFDSTVLSNFLIANAAPLLCTRYLQRGVISWEVYDELSAGFRKEPALRGIDQLFSEKSFGLVTLSKKEHTFYITLLDSLGKGEASCIALARFSGNIVATDDKAARRICESHSIPCTGTIGILLAACREKHCDIDKADQLLSIMIKAGFYSPVRKISDII